MRSTLEFLKIENFRSLRNTDAIKIMPITILVGKNSAGKSTFARSFPLIRQSTETKKRAPILWFGDRVDFGSFDEAICRTDEDAKEITFTFGINILDDTAIKLKRENSSASQELKAEVSISIKKVGTSSSHASKVHINAFGYKLQFTLDENSSLSNVTIEDNEWTRKSEQLAIGTYGAILPTFNFLKQVPIKTSDGNSTIGYINNSPFDEEIAKIFNTPTLEKWKPTYLAIIKRAPLLKRGELIDFINSNLFFEDIAKATATRINKKLESIEHVIFASKINALCELINSGLTEYYKGVKYIEPLRATAQRYYRKQELAVDEIDSKGENLAMFLDNLSAFQLRNFNEWTRNRFGFFATTRKNGGHVEIVINEVSSNHNTNLADIGFGFSQILPVITQIWYSISVGVTARRNTIVIEQPELHLHPAFQAQLADVFAASLSRRTRTNRFIIETHSNHIINRLGQLISKGELNNNSVQILVFEKNSNSETQIRRAGFDSEGYLVNWPSGFFEPEM